MSAIDQQKIATVTYTVMIGGMMLMSKSFCFATMLAVEMLLLPKLLYRFPAKLQELAVLLTTVVLIAVACLGDAIIFK